MRPVPTFHGFVGQRECVRLLQRYIRNAKQRGERLQHILLTGPSGIGKSQLASSVGKEYGSETRIVNGRITAPDLANHLRNIKRADLLFVDEAHRLCSASQELLYPDVLDHWRVPSAGDTTNDAYDQIEQFTLILATDQPGELHQQLKNRLYPPFRLRYYEKREMRAIIDTLAKELPILLTPQAANLLASATHGVPRTAKHLLVNLRGFYSGTESTEINTRHVKKFLRAIGIDRHGLDRDHRDYLQALAKQPASLRTLTAQLGIDENTIATEIEPLLRHKRLIEISSSGRKLTRAGREWIENDATQSSNEGTGKAKCKK